MRSQRGLLATAALVAAALLPTSSRADCNARRGGAFADVPPQLGDARPVIGVLSVPLAGGDAARCVTAAAARAGVAAGALNTSCFSAFYFRWLEAAGARALILPYDAEPALLAQLLDGVNGALLTGGGLEQAGLAFDAPYMVAARQVLDTAKAKVDAGTFFPVHGTCQGMQVISLLASGNASILSYNAFDAENMSLPLQISWDGHHATRIFSANTAPADIVGTLMGENVTLNLHHDGVTPAAFEADANLSRDWVLASINLDRQGRAFCSTLEKCDYPVTATQWHPERPSNEWVQGLGINHGEDSIAANAYVARFFVGDARRNNQSFAGDAGLALLQRYSVFSFPVLGDADAWDTGFQWIVTDL